MPSLFLLRCCGFEFIGPEENDDDNDTSGVEVDEDNAVNEPLKTADDAASEVTVTILLFVSVERMRVERGLGTIFIKGVTAH